MHMTLAPELPPANVDGKDFNFFYRVIQITMTNRVQVQVARLLTLSVGISMNPNTSIGYTPSHQPWINCKTTNTKPLLNVHKSLLDMTVGILPRMMFYFRFLKALLSLLALVPEQLHFKVRDLELSVQMSPFQLAEHHTVQPPCEVHVSNYRVLLYAIYLFVYINHINAKITKHVYRYGKKATCSCALWEVATCHLPPLPQKRLVRPSACLAPYRLCCCPPTSRGK